MPLLLKDWQFVRQRNTFLKEGLSLEQAPLGKPGAITQRTIDRNVKTLQPCLTATEERAESAPPGKD